MQHIWCVIAVIEVLIIGYLGYHKIAYHINIQKMKKDYEKIQLNGSNCNLRMQCPQKDISELMEFYNEIICDRNKNIIEMERLNQNFRKSITNMSHDLRTPLTSAGGYVQMLQADMTEHRLSIEEQKEYLDIIYERQKMVKKLLEQLFEFARLEAGEIEYKNEEVDIRKVFTDTLAMYYNDFEGKNETPEIQILPEPMNVSGDEDALRRVFSNIIYNALVHGSGNYSFECKKQDNGYVIISSNDSEVLNHDDIENLFERFYTKDNSRTRKTTGLGLTIAREIVMRHGGSINAKYLNGRLSIIVWLPCK